MDDVSAGSGAGKRRAPTSNQVLSTAIGSLWALGGIIGLMNPEDGILDLSVGAIAGGILLLPPVTWALRKAAPFFRPVWAPPVFAVVMSVFFAHAAGTIWGSTPNTPRTLPGSNGPIIEAEQESAALYGPFVKRVVAAKLRDADSARFTNVIAYKTGEKLTFCGSVNAKNGLGGYTGPKPFILSDSGFFADETATAERVFELCQGVKTTFVGDF